MNIQCSQIEKLMLYKFELGYNAMKASKNICCMKNEGKVDHSTITRWFMKFCLDCKSLDNQEKSGRSKTVDFKAILHAIEATPVNSICRVLGKLIISQSSVVCHLHNPNKIIWSCCIVPHITKILQSF